MATVTEVTLTCDVCGNTKDVRTWTFGLDGQTYEIDLCPKDGKDLGTVAAGYIARARQAVARQGRRRGGRGPRSERGARKERSRATTATTKPRNAKPAPNKPRNAEQNKPQNAKAAPNEPQKAKADSKPAAKAPGAEKAKGIYVYGILPADIEVAPGQPGVGEHPGQLRVIRSNGLAALISEVDLSGRRESPDDVKTHREILDATATEVPVLPLRFGTVLSSEDAVAEELLAAHHDEFDAALGQLEGCTEFLVTGRYVEAPGSREEETRALEEAMEGVCVASVVREPTHELEAVRIAFLVAATKEGELERVIEDLAREWEGRVDLQLFGPMAAYDFTETAKPG